MTLEIGYPWISYGAIIAIEGLLRKDHKVLELGSGGSTLFWSERVQSVKSYENSNRWLRRVKSSLPQPNNVTFVFGDDETLLQSLRAEPNRYYNWILVDIDPYELRGKMLKESLPKLSRGGVLVIDNYLEPNLDVQLGRGWMVRTFDQINYAKRGTRLCIKI